MSVFDKIKNALFEEEYVEVEEKVRPKTKKQKSKKDHKENHIDYESKPIAKKIVLPEKKVDNSNNNFENCITNDEDFEIVPERENVVENNSNSSMKDNFTESTDYYSEPKIVEVVNQEVAPVEKDTSLYSVKNNTSLYNNYSESNLYSGKKETNLYHNDYNSSISIREYGAYEKKEAKQAFKPSPIISPIYGILDKNYKKEEIVPKKDSRLSSYSRENVNVDAVRKKAFGSLVNDITDQMSDDNYESEDSEKSDDYKDNLLVDLSNDDEKPEVSEITVGDAEEYFRDLGLEYNIDYKDSSKEKVVGRRSNQNYASKEKNMNNKDIEGKTNNNILNDFNNDDNLFDLIDSMYENEE